ncbi:hypothetical protein [Brevibacterium aurantiacum]|uniref:Uncharacterized protein n=1 Tax=Brevibacterium aurantiacum TaxID=273384 RepID=A0A556C501_BREAU|nr:hypothetical protein [Brevibacterium aurantiacum]TSI12460.1 hypothetical protein FO013_20220 [Brevibacterium aurantiacum]
MGNQKVFLLFAKQPSPFDSEEMIDPFIGIVTDERECERFEAEHSEYEVSWEERFINDSEGHWVEPGDTVYGYFYMSTIRESPEGEVLDLLTDAAIESVMYQQANARKMLAIGHIQVITVGDIRLDGNFPVVDEPADWDKIDN